MSTLSNPGRWSAANYGTCGECAHEFENEHAYVHVIESNGERWLMHAWCAMPYSDDLFGKHQVRCRSNTRSWADGCDCVLADE